MIPYVATAATSLLGGYFTRQGLGSRWFECIKPDAMPPNYVFPVVWTILYVLLALSFEAFKDNLYASWLYSSNLVLNVYWCYAFFANQDVASALWSMYALLGITSALFWLTQDLRLIPYLGWLLFATYLTYQSSQKQETCLKFKTIQA